MKYYELHEEFWQRLAKAGHVSWDKEDRSDLMSHERNETLQKYLEKEEKGKSLDLGCGSGSQSFFLSSLGYECTAVDISETAIKIGHKLAKELDLSINFVCSDICKLSLDDKFDLITDSCLLHCLVWEKERRDFFNVAKKHLNQNGKLFIYTMIREQGQKLWDQEDYLHLDNDGVLWSKGPDQFDVEWTEINGEKYFPHRRLYTALEQRDEIERSGFKILDEEILIQADDEAAIYVAWLSL